MRDFGNVLIIIIVIIIGIPLFIIAIPFFILYIPIGYFKKRDFEKKYADFLKANNGKNFFCYNNRKNSIQFIEENILPNLNTEIEIIYINGKKIQSEYNSVFISQALYRLKFYNKFPHLMKIRDGRLIDKSINNPFYAVLNMNKSKTDLLNKVNLFFELNKKLPTVTATEN